MVAGKCDTTCGAAGASPERGVRCRAGFSLLSLAVAIALIADAGLPGPVAATESRYGFESVLRAYQERYHIVRGSHATMRLNRAGDDPGPFPPDGFYAEELGDGGLDAVSGMIDSMYFYLFEGVEQVSATWKGTLAHRFLMVPSVEGYDRTRILSLTVAESDPRDWRALRETLGPGEKLDLIVERLALMRYYYKPLSIVEVQKRTSPSSSYPQAIGLGGAVSNALGNLSPWEGAFVGGTAPVYAARDSIGLSTGRISSWIEDVRCRYACDLSRARGRAQAYLYIRSVDAGQLYGDDGLKELAAASGMPVVPDGLYHPYIAGAGGGVLSSPDWVGRGEPFYRSAAPMSVRFEFKSEGSHREDYPEALGSDFGPLVIVDLDLEHPIVGVEEDECVCSSCVPGSMGAVLDEAPTIAISLGSGAPAGGGEAGPSSPVVLGLRVEQLGDQVFAPEMLVPEGPGSREVEVVPDDEGRATLFRAGSGVEAHVTERTVDGYTLEVRVPAPAPVMAGGEAGVGASSEEPSITRLSIQRIVSEADDPGGGSDPLTVGFRIVREIDGKLVESIAFHRDEGTDGWLRVDEDTGASESLGREGGPEEPVELHWMETRVQRDASGEVVRESRTSRRRFSWGLETVQDVEGEGESALATDYFHHDDPSDPGAFGRLRLVVERGAGWTFFRYDAAGRIVRRMTGLGDVLPPAEDEEPDEAECRVIEFAYATAPGGGRLETVVERLQGREIGRRYVRDEPFRRWDIVCLRPGAAIDAPDNLVTLIEYYRSGPFAGKISRISRPDGTVEIRESDMEADGSWVDIVREGAPSGDGAGVGAGWKRVTTRNPAGFVVSERVEDVATGILLSEVRATTVDANGRPTAHVYADGTSDAVVHGCCGTDSRTGRDGMTVARVTGVPVVIPSAFHVLGDLSGATVRADGSTTSGVTHWRARAGASLVEWKEGEDGAVRLVGVQESDAAGRVVRTIDGSGAATQVDEVFDEAGRLIRTIRHPDGGETVERHFMDGSIASVGGSATVPRRFAVGAMIDGEWFRLEEELDGEGEPTGRWRREILGMTGQVIRIEESSSVAPGGVAVWRFDHDAIGDIVRIEDPTGVVTIIEHDTLRRVEIRGADADRNGVLDAAGVDPIRRRSTTYLVRPDGIPVERIATEVWSEPGRDDPRIAIVEDRALDRETRWITRDGLTWETSTERGGNGTHIVTTRNPDGSRLESIYGVGVGAGRLAREALIDSIDGQIYDRAYEYNGLGDPVAIVDSSGGTTRLEYDPAGRLVALHRPSPDRESSDGEAERYRYDPAGRIEEILLPGHAENAAHGIRQFHDHAGRMVRSEEDRGLTVEYIRDAAGRVVRLIKRGADAGTIEVGFEYDPLSGLMSRRVEAGGEALVVIRDAAGRVDRTIDGRGIERVFIRDGAGRVVGVRYSDGTPGVDLVLGRDGLPTALRDGAGLRRIEYGAMATPEVEVFEDGPFAGVGVEFDRDGVGRLRSRSIRTAEGGVDVGFEYDAASRLRHVGMDGAGVDVDYRDGAFGLAEAWRMHQDGFEAARREVEHDALGRMERLRILADGGATTLIDRLVTHDPSGRRDKLTEDGQETRFAYDSSGRLIAREAHRTASDGTTQPVPGQAFHFIYDEFGLRRSAVLGHSLLLVDGEPDDADPGRSGTVRLPAAVEVRGRARPDAVVSVDGTSVPVAGDGAFHAVVSVPPGGNDGPAVARRVVLEISATVDEITETAQLARTIVSGTGACHYDENGNLLDDGWRRFEWDAENRLVAVELGPERVDDEAAAYRIENTFDALGRRVIRRFHRHVAGVWLLAEERKFVYDGSRIVLEMEGAGEIIRSYAWGDDLSGGGNTAGGAGALRIVRIHRGPAEGTYFAMADTMGNLVALVDAESGEVAARYAYGPFGRLLEMTGPAAPENPFRFSTRYHDEIPELYDYGFRFYDPLLGRWLNRDPIREAGGPSLYGFVGNDPVNRVDRHGLALYAFDGTGNTFDQMTHVGMLYESYRGTREYLNGVGTYFYGPLDNKFVGGLTGYGGSTRIDAMYELFSEHWKAGQKEVDIIGFSRGAALAREFANVLHEKGYTPAPEKGGRSGRKCPQKEEVEIRFVGVFDTVPSFGIPGNPVNLGYRLDLPPNVRHAAHALAMDEDRGLFPLQRLNRPGEGQTFKEAWFAGDHSDIGGGWLKAGRQTILANPPLAFMWAEGRSVGVPFGDLPERKLIDSLVPNDNGGFGHDVVHLLLNTLNPITVLWNGGRFSPHQPRDVR